MLPTSQPDIKSKAKKPLQTGNNIVVTSFGRAFSGLPLIYIYQDVIKEFARLAEQNPGNPSGAFLTGCEYYFEQTKYIEIQGYLDSKSVASAYDMFRYMRDSINHLEPPFGQFVLGWTHQKPDSGATFGPFEMLIHNTFFAHPRYTALITDTNSDEIAFYQRDQRGQFRNVGFWVIAEKDNSKQPADPSADR